MENYFDTLALLPDGWGDGIHNKRFSKKFLHETKLFAMKVSSMIGFDPIITPMDGNSLDLHWKNDKVQLLVNVMEFTPEKCGLFGRTLDGMNELKFSGNTDELLKMIVPVSQWQLLFE